MALTTDTGKVGGGGLPAVGVSFRVGATAAAALALIPIALASSAPAGEVEHVLTEKGTKLGILYTSGKVDDLRFIVNLNGDQPTATYVWATVAASYRRVRTNEGYWLPFDGNVAHLIDNQFPIKDGKVTFKVLDEDIGVDNLGVDISIGYKAGETLKYGTFAILPKTAGQ